MFSARIERKSEGDFLSCVAAERPRFERELERLKAFPIRCVIVETCWAKLEAGGWRSPEIVGRYIENLDVMRGGRFRLELQRRGKDSARQKQEDCG